jgi:amino acid adenylation domain-containing protein
MTDMQLAFLQAGLADPGMNIIHYHETHSPDNIPALKKAWRTVTEPEPILRSTYELSEPGAYLVEQHGTDLDWEETLAQDEETYQQLIEDNCATEYGFFGSSFRVITLRGSCGQIGKSRVIWKVHHALIDGYSHLLLLEKVRKYLAGESVKPGTPFVHFAAGLHALQTSSYDAAKAFWARKYEDHPHSASRLLLPTPSKSSISTKRHFPIVSLKVDVEELSMRCRHLGFTLPTLYHAAWALTLAKYTGSDDVVFGTVLCGRSLPIPGVASVIGPTLNTLPVYVKLNRTSSFTEGMRHVFEQILELASYQWTTPKHGFNREFRTALNVRISGDQSSMPAFQTLEPSFSTIRSEISLQVEILDEGMMRLHYDPTQYSQSHIERLATVYENAISMVRNASSTVETCLSSILTIPQRLHLGVLGNWDNPITRNDYVQDDLVSLFTRIANQNPSTVALQRGKTNLTYGELNIQSSIASQEILHLVAPGSIVCVHADRSINWIIAMYAVLKAGGVYCPLDEQLPMSVRDQNFVTSKAQLFLVGSDSDKSKKPPSCKLCLSVEELLRNTPLYLDSVLLEPRKPRPNRGAYLCFTSGSTGKPKGVLCRHSSLVAFQSNDNVRLRARVGWKIAQFMSPAFDGSIHEIFSALTYGATLVLKDPLHPLDHLRQADAAILTPSVARALDHDEFPGLKVVYLVGEAVTEDICEAWAKTKTLYNMYGPTEATCGASIKQLFPGNPITLGKPNPSTRIYILDSHQELIPQGTIGEICLAGVQVSSGYVGRPEETAKRFLLDPIHPQWGELMYKTGDKGYWNEEGELVFLGRSDRQIKLRGFRIDMDDLEIQMLRADTEATAVAVALVDGSLIAQVQPRTLDLDRFRLKVQNQIPAYALPRRIIAVDSFPMTAVGKLDYKKIGQDTDWNTVQGELNAISATNVEERIINAIPDVIGVCSGTEIEPLSSFLDLVGTSMHLIALSQRLSKVLESRIPVRLLLHYPTPRELAQSLLHIHARDGNETSCTLGDSGVSPIEKDWWNKYQVSANTSAFNVNFVSELESTIDKKRLTSAWNIVLDRHRILRCYYQHNQEHGVRRAYHEQPPIVKLVQSLDVDREIHEAFDLQQGPLIRVLLSPSHMVIVVSHIICDLTTLNALLREVATIYHGKILEPVKPYSKTRWSTTPPPSHLAFWSEYLENTKTPTYFGLKQIKRSTWEGTSHIIRFPNATYEQMKAFAAARKVTMHQLALAAVALALANDGEAECDITIGAPYLNRNSEDDQNVVGLFLEPLPIRIKYPTALGEHEQKSFIHAVQSSSRAALAHAVSFHRLLSHLSVTPAYPTHPLFDVVVTFHEASQRPVCLIPGTKPQDMWTRGAKFKLMAEFSEVYGSELALRLEYSTECFDEGDVAEIGKRIGFALARLSAGKAFDEVRGSIRDQQG